MQKMVWDTKENSQGERRRGFVSPTRGENVINGRNIKNYMC